MNAETSERLVTASEIAEIAGVGASAVSNWRKRHTDFPLPADSHSGGDLFRLEEVTAWLEQHGKAYVVPDSGGPAALERAVWNFADATRSVWSQPAAALTTTLQLLWLQQQVPSLENGLPSTHQAFVEQLDSAAAESETPAAFEPVEGLEAIPGGALSELSGALEAISWDEAELRTAASQLILTTMSKRGGEYVSETSIRDLLIELLLPLEGDIYDPACGTGNFLTAACRASETPARLFGQEINLTAWRIAVLQLLLNGCSFDIGNAPSDVFQFDVHRHLRAQRIGLDTPIGQRLSSSALASGDQRWEYGLPGPRADWAWVQHALWHLDEAGWAAIVCSPAALFGEARDSQVRTKLLEADVIDAIIHLPGGLLASTSIEVAVLLLAKHRPARSGEVLFLDAQQLGTSSRGRHELPEQDIKTLGSAVRAWRQGTLEPQTAFSATATIEEILHNDSVLSPSRYVSYALETGTIDGEAIGDRYRRLRDTLARQQETARDSLAEARTTLRNMKETDQ